MESEGVAVMVAVLESLVEEEPFHSSTITLGDDDDDISMADSLHLMKAELPGSS